MASIPVKSTLNTQTTETVEDRFERLAAVWRDETSHLSSSTQMAAHPAYEEIIALGQDVVPLLLRELAREPDHWFTALKRITGANPVDPVDRGRIDKMAEAWLKWGKKAGYRW